MMVAVGFNPRTREQREISSGHRAQHGRRRLKDIQSSLRDGRHFGGVTNRGLKPTATVVTSLRDKMRYAEQIGNAKKTLTLPSPGGRGD